MCADDRFPDRPPLEAYSRVTDPERFLPLHAHALSLLEGLEAQYDVSRAASFDPLPGMTPFEHARPPVSLTPALPAAAPVAVAFTTFPGLLVRFGRWQGDAFPSCGCDACRETAAGEGERFERLIGEVVAGRFREELTIPWLRQPRLRWWLGESSATGEGRSCGFGILPRSHALELRRSGTGTVKWQPWPRRLPGGAD